MGNKHKPGSSVPMNAKKSKVFIRRIACSFLFSKIVVLSTKWGYRLCNKKTKKQNTNSLLILLYFFPLRIVVSASNREELVHFQSKKMSARRTCSYPHQKEAYWMYNVSAFTGLATKWLDFYALADIKTNLFKHSIHIGGKKLINNQPA